MKIEIADRLKAFSHAPGHSFIVPGTRFSIQAFPTALVFSQAEGKEIELHMNLKGPVNPFTIEQDLEAKLVRIYGEALQGYFRLSVKAEENKLMLFFEKTPPTGILIGERCFFSGDFLEIAKDILVFKEPFQERLFLGSSKKKESDQIRQRRDLREIFPLWYRLGATTPLAENKEYPSLFLESAIEKKDKKTAQDLFLHTYLAHFTSGLVPRKEDIEKQGLSLVMEFSNELLFQGFNAIRSLFFREKEGEFHILPCLFPLFVCGRLIQLKSKSGCIFDIEWTKHRLRKMFIHVEKDQVLNLHFPVDVACFRIKRSRKDKGKIVSAKEAIFPVKAGDFLSLDLFQK